MSTHTTQQTTTTTTHVDPKEDHSHTAHKDTHTHPHTATTTTHGHNNTHKPIASTHATTGVTGAEDTTGTDRIVKTGNYVTGLEHHAVNPTPIPVVGASHQNRIVGMEGAAGPAPRVNAGPLHSGVTGAPTGVGGSLGGAVVLGGQCECPGGVCTGKCRGAATPVTTVNPGQNTGVSDTVDHTAAHPHPM